MINSIVNIVWLTAMTWKGERNQRLQVCFTKHNPYPE